MSEGNSNIVHNMSQAPDVGFKASATVKITDKMVRQFAEMSGDINPIHLDDDYAKTTRFGRRIAHGMILGALVSRLMNEKIGAGGIYLAQSLKFSNPVYIDEEIIFELELIKLHRTRGFGIIETNARRLNGEFVMKGEATIMLAFGVK